MSLTDEQRSLVEAPLTASLFLEGPAGTGKTTVGVHRLLHLLKSGVPGENILLFVPQRTLAHPYLRALSRGSLPPGGEITVLTLGGLARRMVDLFWPMIGAPAGFAHPEQPPGFLTLETAQYFMARVVEPLLEEGYFETVTLNRNRLYSQIIDNLNKAALIGFPHTEIADRLNAAWVGEESQRRVFADAQECANRFRQYCLANNLLDFSLQVAVFLQYIWPQGLCRDYLLGRYPHLLVDNLEEDTPAGHDLLLEWLPHCDSALFIMDWDSGYRQFLGADPVSAARLREACDQRHELTFSLVTSPQVESLSQAFSIAFGRPVSEPKVDYRPAISYLHRRYLPEMLDGVAQRVADLVQEEGVPPREIVILAPFLSDALRFSLLKRLEATGVPAQSQRPSRSLGEEPVVRCLVTLTKLAHPKWDMRPSRFDVAQALSVSIADLDRVRAQLLTETLYRPVEGIPTLLPFDRLGPEMAQRITPVLGDRYEALRGWIETHRLTASSPLDHFLTLLFGELLSKKGFGFFMDIQAGRVTANLIESVKKFRHVVEVTVGGEVSLGREYVQMIEQGVIAAQFLRSWTLTEEDAVLLMPAYTFLMSNRPVDVQVWLNIGGRGWGERIYQPLTHPYVLSRNWSPGRLWTDTDELETNRQTLYRVVMGLFRRCRRQIILGLSDLDEQGYEPRGLLLRVFGQVLQQAEAMADGNPLTGGD